MARKHSTAVNSKQSEVSILPDPELEKDPATAKVIQAANSAVVDLVSPSRKRKRVHTGNMTASKDLKLPNTPLKAAVSMDFVFQILCESDFMRFLQPK